MGVLDLQTFLNVKRFEMSVGATNKNPTTRKTVKKHTGIPHKREFRRQPRLQHFQAIQRLFDFRCLTQNRVSNAGFGISPATVEINAAE